MSYILVVDDDYHTRELLQDALTFEGYEVRTASDGAQALDLVMERQPALILLDMRMPTVDGREFVRHYQQVTGPHAPIIGLSASTTRLDSDAFVEKPFDLHELLGVVEKYLRECRN